MLKSIVDNLIPQNLKNTEVIKEAIDVFLDYIIEKSKISLDIYNLYSDKNEVIFEELLKIFTANMYYTLKNNINNETLIQRLDQVYQKAGYKNFRDIVIDDNILNIINKQTLESFKLFQQTKGHKSSIEYVYNIIEQMKWQQGILESDGYFNFEESKDNVFEYKVEGSLISELFEYFVKPIAHPVGWAYIYTRLYNLYFTDYFLSKPVYDISSFYIGCLSSDNNKRDDFLKNEGWLTFTDKDEKNIKDKMYFVNGKPHQNITRFGKDFEVLDLKSEINLIQDKEVINIEDNKNPKKHIITVFFKSGEKLEYISDPKSLILYYFESENPLKAKIKKNYNEFLGHCGLNLQYTTKVVTTIKDKLQFALDFGFSNTTGFLATVGAGNLFVNQARVSQKYIERNVPVTYKTKIKNETLLNSNYKNIYKINFYEKHRTLDSIYLIDNNLHIFYNNLTFEDSQSPYTLILDDKLISLDKDSNNVIIPFNFDKKHVFNFKILDKNSKVHEESSFKLDEIKQSDFIKDLFKESKFKFDNPYYYNNIVGQFNLNDQTLDLNGKFIGNSGCLCYDEFSIESIKDTSNGVIYLDFTEKFKSPRDDLESPKIGYYQSLWGMQSGHVDVYNDDRIIFTDTFKIRDQIKIDLI